MLIPWCVGSMGSALDDIAKIVPNIIKGILGGLSNGDWVWVWALIIGGVLIGGSILYNIIK